jgi:excisionase family DNA binding protein
VDPKTVRRYIAQGRLKAVRVGSRLIRVERESLLALATPVGNY